MPDEQNPTPTNEGVSTEANATPNENAVSVDRAELEALRASQATLKELDGFAGEAQYGNAKEYLEALEQTVYQAEEAQKPPAESAVEQKPTATTPTSTPAPVTAGLNDADRKLLAETDKRSQAAFVAAQQQGWEAEQSRLPEDQRSAAKPEELLKLLYSNKGQLIAGLAKEFGGNVFKAADYLHGIDAGKKQAFKAGADSATAMHNAATSANLSTGGKTAVPTVTTPDERQAAWEKEQADSISPDDAPIE